MNLLKKLQQKRQDSLSEKDLDEMEDIKCTHKDTIKEDTNIKNTEELKEEHESPKENATNEKVSPQMVDEDLNTKNTKEETVDEYMECDSSSQITSCSDEKITAVDNVDISEALVTREENSKVEPITKDSLEEQENFETRVTKKEAEEIKEAISNAENLIKKKISEKTNAGEKLEVPPSNKFQTSSSKTSQKNVSRNQSPVESRGASKEEEEKIKDEVPSTPIVRRRGDTFTVVLPPPRGKPPPPPMSPPVPVSKVKDLEMENKLVIGANKQSESDSESGEEVEEEEEESEWEWTEEEESESECEVKKEEWDNILSSSKGPTTFKAEYSVKV